MSNPIKPDDSLATGVQATHIGPETGRTGAASMGGASGAGVSSDVSPPAGAGMGRTLEQLEEQEAESGEPRSFDPVRRPQSAKGLGDAPEAVKRASDGE